jgi:hypothetical protein
MIPLKNFMQLPHCDPSLPVDARAQRNRALYLGFFQAWARLQKSAASSAALSQRS